MHGIAEWEVGWTITLRLVLVNAAGCVRSATGVLTEFTSVTDASLMRITLAARVAGTLKTVQSLPTLRVYAARSSQALISACNEFE